MGDLEVSVGEIIPRSSSAGRVRVTPLMGRVLPRLREVLVDVALDHAYLQQGLGPVLDVLAADCARRGEPRLDALVVTRSHGEVSHGFDGNAVRDREACWAHWSC